MNSAIFGAVVILVAIAMIVVVALLVGDGKSSVEAARQDDPDDWLW